MPAIILYFIKLSVSLSVVFLFYHFILQKLTFYNSNRWYLLGYTALSFFIPFINISPVLEKNSWNTNVAVSWIPIISNSSVSTETVAGTMAITAWDTVIIMLLAGMLIILSRLVIQLLSVRKIWRKATVIHNDGMNLYQVDENIIPFSFGNSIFINRNLHSGAELQEIIRHEFVHVKQRHSLDILWGELLCMINWYNPFAWLLKKAIRQNLEFIADKKVLENGFDKKQYQYLLLKVIGNSQFSIATQFNFSSLKKRIAMMNKTKSHKRQLLRLLFLLPATAVLLLAFRNKWNYPDHTKKDAEKKVSIAGLVVDAATMKPVAGATIFCKEKNITVQTDANGYYKLQLPYENKELLFSLLVSKNGYGSIDQQEHWGNFYQDHIYKSYGKTIEFFGLSAKGEGFSSIIGNASDESGLDYSVIAGRINHFQSAMSIDYELKDTVPFELKANSKGYYIDILDNNGDCMVRITDKNGKEVERVLLSKWKEVKKYEQQYGEILMPPAPPEPPTPNAPEAPALPPTPPALECPGNNVTPPAAVAGSGLNMRNISSEFEITDKKAVLKLKDGTVETYDLTNKKERAAFEAKYGKLVNINTNVNVTPVASINGVYTVKSAIATTVNANINANVKAHIATTVHANVNAIGVNGEPVTITTVAPVNARGSNMSTVIAPAALSTTRGGVAMASGNGVNVIGDYGYTITGNEDIVITIKKTTTRQELNNFIKLMKDKGVDLDFDDIEYNDKGVLVGLNGTMKSGGSQSNFVASDFESITLAMIKKGDKTYFKVSTRDKNEVI